MAIELCLCGSLLFERLQNVCPLDELRFHCLYLAHKTVPGPMLAYRALSLQLVVS